MRPIPETDLDRVDNNPSRLKDSPGLPTVLEQQWVITTLFPHA